MMTVPARWLRVFSLLGFLGGLAAAVTLTFLAFRPTAPERVLAAPPATTEEKPPERRPVASPAVQVLTFSPGMPAATIEKTITNRIERWVNQAPNVRRVESHSIAGASIVCVFFHKDADPASALTQVNSLALGTLPTLPSNTLPPLVLPLEPGHRPPLGLLTISNAAMDEAQLKDVARIDVRNGLSAVEGCLAPVVLGGKERTIVVNLDPRKLEARKLSPLDVLAALQKDKTVLAPGTFSLGKNQIQLLPEERFDLNKLHALPIKSDGNQSVLLGDVGAAEDAYAIPMARMRVDGRRTVGVPIFALGGANPTALQRELTQFLPNLEARLPEGTRLAFVPFGVARKGEEKGGTGLVRISVQAPSGLRLDESEKRIIEVEALLKAEVPANERLAIITDLGVTPDFSAAYTRNEGPQDATIYLPLSTDRRLSARAYAGRLRQALAKDRQFADLRFHLDADGQAPPLAVQISGGSSEALLKQARIVRDALAGVSGAVDARIVQRQDAPALVLDVDREKAAGVGLSARDVFLQATMALNVGLSVPGNAGEPFSVTVQYPESPALKLDEALDVAATGTNQAQPVKLSSLVSLRRVGTPMAVDHVGLQRVITVEANVEERDLSEVVKDIEKKLKEMQVPEGLRLDLEAQAPQR